MGKLFGGLLFCTAIALTYSVPAGAESSALREGGSVYLMEEVEPRTDFVPRRDCGLRQARHRSFNLAIVDFRDDGSLRDAKQFSDGLACIRSAGKHGQNLTVVLFIHGWRHSSAWSDTHFLEFRRLLQRLALREVEGRAGRRIFGVFVGWPGGTVFDLFNPSYERAQRIGSSPAFKEMLRDVIETTRTSSPASTVLFTGHSLGAAMLEAGYSSLLSDIIAAPAATPPRAPDPCKVVTGVARPELLPDLVLLLGTASEAQLTQTVISKMRGRISKRITCGVTIEAPLVAYVASESDRVTEFAFWVRRGLERTAGNTDTLTTHELVLVGPYACPAKRSLEDFGQSWHCLRAPQLDGARVSVMTMDLPRPEDPRDSCHLRYVARPNAKFQGADIPPFWILRVPDEIVSGHNDIFNARSALVAMVLLQTSGATVGIWENYSDMFEPDGGVCSFR